MRNAVGATTPPPSRPATGGVPRPAEPFRCHLHRAFRSCSGAARHARSFGRRSVSTRRSRASPFRRWTRASGRPGRSPPRSPAEDHAGVAATTHAPTGPESQSGRLRQLQLALHDPGKVRRLPASASPPGNDAADRSRTHICARRSSWALMATITVLRVMSTAPIAGDSSTPNGTSTPAASGIATTLYPVAHQRFCTIFR